jgi:hypothetical protein
MIVSASKFRVVSVGHCSLPGYQVVRVREKANRQMRSDRGSMYVPSMHDGDLEVGGAFSLIQSFVGLTF